MDLSKFLAELLVVIVLFKKKPEQSSAYISIQTAHNILPSFPAIFIYDNSPHSCLLTDSHIIYRHDPENSGVSKAYNEAVVLATKKNKKWMLLLDQDTNVDTIIFQKFLDSTLKYPASVAFVPKMKDEIGLLSPFQFSSGRGKRMEVCKEKYLLENFRFINSGLFIQCSAFLKAGGYEENIPLDFSDIAFGEKLKKITDHFIVIDTTLDNPFSGTTPLKLNEALARFHYFCTGAFNTGKKFGPFYIYFTRAFFRASHLCFKYRSLRFIKIFLQRSVHG